MSSDATRIYAALSDRVLTVERTGGGATNGAITADWTASERLVGTDLECLAASEARPDRAFAGTAAVGVQRTTDGGDTWERVAPEVTDRVTALAVSPHDSDVVWAGTEPSAVYRSSDGGDSWKSLAPVTDLPSEPEWSFPPRPHTHHVRWIEPDPTDPERLYVSIEAGALLRTDDGGETWEDRPGEPEPGADRDGGSETDGDRESGTDGTGGGPWGDPERTNGARRDNHTLATHPDREGRVYAAAGDGYAQSSDGGDSWVYPQNGLDHRYVWGIAVPESDPGTVVASAATGATMAHGRDGAESYVYRTTDADDPASVRWERAMDGLPDPDGTVRTVLAAGSGVVLYAANNYGLFRSPDAGASWDRLPVEWGGGDTSWTPGALAVV